MSQTTSSFRPHWIPAARWTLVGALLAIAAGAGAYYRELLPPIQSLLDGGGLTAKNNANEAKKPVADQGHAGHDHGGHNSANSIEMSPQARKNIGLQVTKIELQPFVKSITVPGMVVERPGHSIIEVTAPMTGVITRIYLTEGEAIEPGQKLFDLRLTHEELVQLQAEFLQTAEELGVIAREIKRIEQITQDGALPGKQLLERKYEQQKQEAVLRSKRQALLLHGLTNTQIDAILESRELLKDLTVFAPSANNDAGMSALPSVFQVQSLKTAQGQHVSAGDTLVILANHAELYIEGEAFERDVADISRAVDAESNVSAVMETEGSKPEVVSNLRVLYLSAKVNPEKRTLDFFVKLPNEKQRDTKSEDGQRFIAWKFRPGQRVQLHIPVETLPDRIVLPIDSLAQDGVETYVFTPNGDHFDRRSVHVEFRDTRSAVIANDGSVFPGDMVAISGAQQLQLALKNKSGGGIDPHAGHNH